MSVILHLFQFFNVFVEREMFCLLKGREHVYRVQNIWNDKIPIVFTFPAPGNGMPVVSIKHDPDGFNFPFGDGFLSVFIGYLNNLLFNDGRLYREQKISLFIIKTVKRC